MSAKAERVGRLLFQNKERLDWSWLSRKRDGLDKRSANKFLLACIVDDFGTTADRAWDATRRFAEEVLKDPADLWHRIRGFDQETWRKRKLAFALHPFQPKHMRVWRIAGDVVSRYGGDARRLWQHRPASDVLDSLLVIRVGSQISRMVVGALFDERQLNGRLDVKADRHVCRVLGRIFYGNEIPPAIAEHAVTLAREVYPRNPWVIDGPIYMLGKGTCRPSRPRCGKCYLSSECKYAKNSRV